LRATERGDNNNNNKMSPPCALRNHHHHQFHTLPTPIKTPIIPTYISTDLVTPGKPNRETLPGIGQRERKYVEQKLWGQDTKLASNGDELAYNHFKASHYLNGPEHSKVVVSHRHHGSRTYNIVTSNQPYQLTNLLPSKCRLNDQRMPQPFQSTLVHDNFIPEPYCKEFCNSYFSHRSQFQVFPTNNADLIDAETTSIKVPTKFKLTDRTKQALSDLNKQCYSTTTYHQFHQQQPNTATAQNKNRRKNVRFKIFVRTCKLCGFEINQNRPKTAKKSAAAVVTPTTDKDKKKITTKLYWPPGELNISNNHSNYPKVKLPKYCLRPQSLRKKKATCEGKEQKFCKCTGNVPVMINSYLATPSNENLVKKDGVVKRRKTPAAPKGMMLGDKRSEEKLLPRRLSSAKIKRGFKTDARHKFLREHQETIPNLSDAVQTGKKHDFFGWNVNFFRG